MSELAIRLERDPAFYKPGELICGRASWTLTRSPRQVLIQLGYVVLLASGANEESECIATQTVPEAAQEGFFDFEFTAPEAPHAFHGSVLSLKWVAELVVQPGDLMTRAYFSISLGAGPVRLSPLESVQEHAHKRVE